MVRAMTIARSNALGLALLACCVISLGGCNRVNNKQQYAPIHVVLTYDLQTKTCTQSVGGIPVKIIGLKPDQHVKWAAANDSFDVQFPAAKSPFAKNDFRSAYGGEVDSGPATGTVNVTYPYYSVKVHGDECQNSLELGFIMR
jgi:hypothetical protein